MKQKIQFIALLFVIVGVIPSESLYAERLTDLGNDSLRSESEVITSFNLHYVNESSYNISGGIKRGYSNLNNIYLQSRINLGRLISVNSLELGIKPMINYCRKSNQYFGTVQGVSNIEAENMFTLMELWVQKHFYEDKLSVLIGLYDLNSEFDVKTSSGLFSTPSQGIGSELGLSGKKGPSIFPYPGMAVRVSVKPYENFEIKAVAVDGVPNYSDAFVKVRFNSSEGLLMASEIDCKVKAETENIIGIGYWAFTAKHPVLAAQDVLSFGEEAQGNNGAFVFFDVPELYSYSKDGIISACFRYGIANKKFNEVSSHLTCGCVLNSLFFHQDELGFNFSCGFLNKQYASENGLYSSEKMYEATYVYTLIEQIKIQPTLLYVSHPSAGANIKDAFGGSIRVILDL